MKFKSFFFSTVVLLTILGGFQLLSQKINAQDHEYSVDATLSCAQPALEIDTLIEPYFNQFIKDCEKRGIDEKVFEKIYDNVDVILTLQPGVRDEEIGVAISQKLWGVFISERRGIYINKDILNDTLKTKMVMYHELAHAVGVKHSCEFCEDIMSAHKSDYSVYQGEYLEQKLNVFFERIKQEL